MGISTCRREPSSSHMLLCDLLSWPRGHHPVLDRGVLTPTGFTTGASFQSEVVGYYWTSKLFFAEGMRPNYV